MSVNLRVMEVNTKNTSSYVAFLRGINVGGNRLIKMTDLVVIFQKMGFTGVKTYIASGNVLFQSPIDERVVLKEVIEKGLKEALGYAVFVILRNFQELDKIIQKDPFRALTESQAKFYVTFLPLDFKLDSIIRAESPTHEFELVAIDTQEVYTASFPLPVGGFGDSLTPLGKEINKTATTRNWNTVLKLWKLMQ